MKTLNLRCPKCASPTVYSIKSFTKGMTKTLVALCKEYRAGNTFISAKDKNLSPGDLAKLELFGFVSQQAPSGRKKQSGLWAPTAPGWAFANGEGRTAHLVFLDDRSAVSGFGSQTVSAQESLGKDLLSSLWA